MRKWISVWCGVFFAALAAAGCANPGSTEKSTESQQSAQIEQQDAGGKREEAYTVNMLMAGMQQEDFPRISEKINEITMKELNMKLNLTIVPFGSIQQQRQLMLTSGESLDLVFLETPSVASGFIKNGQLLEISELLDRHADSIKELWGEANLKAVNVGGFVYGVTNFGNIGSRSAIGMRKDLVDKYNIDASSIHTLEDLESVLTLIKEKEPGVTPLYIAPDQLPVSDRMNLFDQLIDGLAVLENNGTDNTKVMAITESPVYMETCKLLHKWYQEGLINSDAATTTIGFESAFQANTAFSALMGWFPNTPKKFGGQDMVYAYLGDQVIISGANSYNAYGIAASSKDPDKAMQMLDFLFRSSEVEQLLNWGEEGIDWVYVDKEKNIADFPEGVNYDNAGYHAGYSWALPNQFISSTWNGVADWDVYQQTIEFNNNPEAKKSMAFGFSYDTSAIETELAAINNVRDKFKASIETGSVDPEEYIKKYNEELKQAGIEKVIEEKQRQLNEWLAKQQS